MNDPKRELAERIADEILNAHGASGNRVEVCRKPGEFSYSMDRGAFIGRIERALGHLGAVPPLAPSGQDEKIPTAGAERLADRATQIACAEMRSMSIIRSHSNDLTALVLHSVAIARHIEEEAAK